MKIASLLLLVSLAAATAIGQSPAERIDPLIGSEGVGRGSCMPGPCLPHASVYPSPDSDRPQPSGYDDRGGIVGFSPLHCQGMGGAPSFGNVLISPQIGLHTAEKDHLSPKADEQASAFRYAVTLTRDNIKCEVVPGAHSVLYKFLFPASNDAHIVIDAARRIGSAKALADGGVSVQPETATISGGGVYAGNWAPGPYRIFFTAEISKPPTSFGTWTGGKINAGTAHAAIQHTEGGGFVGFSTRENEVVYLKIGLSFKSAEQSAQWLHAEIPAWDFEKLETQAKQAWNDELGTVSIADWTDR